MAKIAVACEVVAGITLPDHWDVLRTQQRTGTPYMLLENVCYRRDVLAVLQMVRQGLFGELIHLQGGYQHDVSLPRPYSLGFRVQGTDGLWMDVNKSVHVEGRSPRHRWEDAQKYYDEFDHPLWRKYADKAAGAGHGGMDWFVVHAFVEALKAGDPMPIDIYDAVAWSAITLLSEQSIAEGYRTLDFPDFTEGKWKERSPIFAFNDRY